MDNKYFRGYLKRWNDDRGFGFIGAENGKGDIFIHISALKKMSRRPIIGDRLSYQIHLDNSGKKRAVNAYIEGVSEIQPRIKSKTLARHPGNRWLSGISTVIVVLVLLATGNKIYRETSGVQTHVASQQQTFSTPNQAKFRCSGKTHCSECVFRPK